MQVNPHFAIDGQRHTPGLHPAASAQVAVGFLLIADALGYHPSTIERRAIGSASTDAEYIAAARELRQTPDLRLNRCCGQALRQTDT